MGVRMYAKTCAIDVWVEGIRRGTPHGERVRRPRLSYPLTATERSLRETLTTYYSGDSASHEQDLGRPLRRRGRGRPRCNFFFKRSASMLLARLWASLAILPDATTNHRRLSRQYPNRSRVSLVQHGRSFLHFIEHFRISPSNLPLV